MKFDHSGMFSLLIIIVPVIIFSVIHFRLKFPIVCRLTNPLSNNYENRISKKTLPKGTKKNTIKNNLLNSQKELRLRYIFSLIFFILFYIFTIIALSGPRWGRQIIQELQRGADVVMAFDISRSMNVRDASSIETNSSANNNLSASRLERSVWIVKQIIESFSGKDSVNLRIGIAIGKGDAVLAIPLTDDREAAMALIDGLNDLSMTSRGTNLEKLLDVSSTAFKDDYPSARHVILFTDGEALSGQLNLALERLNAKNISVLGVGSGSVYGAPVPNANTSVHVNDGTLEAKKRVKPIISYLKADLLSGALARNNGIYIDGNREDAPTQIISNIKMQDASSTWVSREISGDRSHVFILMALASLALSVLCTQRLKRK
ncbi:hypothetical protein FACS1894102_3380 [Spirochaetia bacterium]|nr:hypothetical protein FACS1894102_3380 [Spirochaetia bacterium]